MTLKHVLAAYLVPFLLGPCLAWSQEGEADEPTAEASRDVVFVEEVQPVPDDFRVGFDSITGDDLRSHLRFIASDSLHGRDTGTEGHLIAAEYAAAMFSLWGLSPAGDPPPRPSRRRMMMGPTAPNQEEPSRSFLQQIELKETINSTSSATAEWRRGPQVKSITFAPDVDYQFDPSDSETISSSVVFVGYGISEEELGFDEYDRVETEGKIVMMFDGLPAADDPESVFAREELRKRYDPKGMGRMPRHMPSHRNRVAQDHGAVAIIFVDSTPEEDGDVAGRVMDGQRIDDGKPIISGKRRRLSLIGAPVPRSFTKIPEIRVSREMADDILELIGEKVEPLKRRIEGSQEPHSMELAGVRFTIESTLTTRLVRSPNVLGYLEGSDSELKDEVVVVGAHLDHLGQRGDYIYNGADDNGSGSVAVLEIARAFSSNPVKPKRTVLFALWTGEEKGLLGSRYYVTHPFFAMDKVVANLNLDMVSREWDKTRLARLARMFGVEISDEELEAIDVSKLLTLAFDDQNGNVSQKVLDANQHVGLTLIMRESEGPGAGGGSDHMPFAFSGIPWAFMFSAMTEDFHEPSDSVEKTSKALMERIARLAFLTAFLLSDG